MLDPGKLALYLVTDPLLGGKRGVTETCRQALEAGVRTIQLRDKQASTRELLDAASELLEICRRNDSYFFVNDRVDVALASGADGVHLGQDDMPLHMAREILGSNFLIGVSVRTPEEALGAWRGGADYIAANMVFATETKRDLPEPLGLERMAELKGVTPLPLIAIGGINESNAAAVVEAGADGIAVVSAIMSAPDVRASVKGLIEGILPFTRGRNRLPAGNCQGK